MASEAVVTDARDEAAGAGPSVAPTGLVPRLDPPAIPATASSSTPCPTGLTPACDFQTGYRRERERLQGGRGRSHPEGLTRPTTESPV